MGSADIVVFKDVFVQNIMQMLFVENDHMVETLPAKCADDPFANWILPWTSWGSRCVFQTEISYLLLEVSTEYFIIISDDIFCGFIKSKGFTKLLNCPLRVRICSNRKV